LRSVPADAPERIIDTRVVIRRYVVGRDEQALRECVIAQQNFHRSLEPLWPEGEKVVEDYLAYLHAECAAHNGCILMAELGEDTAGFASVVAAAPAASPDDPAPFAWLHDVYVKPEHRRHGIATMLLAEAERFARAEGARVLRLGVLDRNQLARGFYARLGFRQYTHVLTKSLE
jgi:GNAT superfamily N-acetyltransferase